MLGQSFQDFDLLFIDDRSTDRSIDVITSYKDPRIHLLSSEKNGGVVSALNRGLDMVDHKFIARMDADDRSTPDRFEKQMNFLDQHPEVDILGAGIRQFGSIEEEWTYPVEHSSIKANFLFGNCFPHASLMARANVFATERYSSRVPHMEDYELWLRLVQRYTFATLPDKLYEYRRHEEAVTISSKHSQRERLRVLIKEPLSWLGIDPSSDELSLMADDRTALDGGSAQHFKTYYELLAKIRSANDRLHVFDPTELNKTLDYNWKRSFYLMRPTKVSDIFRYWWLSKSISLGQLRYALGAIRAKG